MVHKLTLSCKLRFLITSLKKFVAKRGKLILDLFGDTVRLAITPQALSIFRLCILSRTSLKSPDVCFRICTGFVDAGANVSCAIPALVWSALSVKFAQSGVAPRFGPREELSKIH